MSLDINLYRDRLNAYKVSGKEGKIDSIKKQILDDFISNPSHEEVVISNETRDVHIVTEGAKGNRVLCKPNENINVGEYIIWNNKHFLCTHRFPDDKVQTKGTIQKCNHNLKWINKNNQLITRPCIEDARTLYTTGVKDEKVIEIPNGMVGIQLPYDEETRQLNRGDSFVFNKTKYKITFYDETTYKGLVILICTETAINTAKDDLINEIADRWIEVNGEKVDRLPWLDDQKPPIEPEPPTEPEEGITYTITSIDKYDKTDIAEIWANDWAKYTIHKFIDGIEVSGVFTFEIDNTNLATITNITDNTATVTAKDVRRGGDVKLTIIDVDTGEIAIEQTIKIVGY